MRHGLFVVFIALLSADASAAVQRADAHYTLRMVAADAVGGGDGAISPSGRFIAISSRRTGSVDIWIYDIDQQTWTRITKDPGDEFEAQWAPDEKRLAYTTTEAGNKDIAVINLVTHEVKRITTSPDDDEYPAWSPDGTSIVYTGGPWKRRHFYVIPADGGTPRQITRLAGMAGACSFAPDGQSLICHRYDSGSGNVVRIALRDGKETPLTSGGAWDYKPTLSPDGRWLAFSRASESPSSIYLMALDGGEPRPLVTTDADDRWPTWSAAGHKLLFHRSVAAGVALRVIDRKTKSVRTIAGEDEQPGQGSFDPAGKRVVYATRQGGRSVLRITDLSTRERSILATAGFEAAFPRWSPDGNAIAFLARINERWTIATIAPDGTQFSPLPLPAELRGMYGPIDWSPDGKRIAFKADGEAFEADLYVAGLRDATLRNVTNDHWWNESPAWTADGTSLTFMSTRGGGWTWGLFRMNLGTGAIDVLSAPDYTEKYFPRNAADGATVWTSNDEGGPPRLMQRSASGAIRRLDEAGDGVTWPSFSADGRFVVYTVVRHRIEYWIAENPTAQDSPVMRPKPTGEERVSLVRSSLGRTAAPALRESPVQLLHR
jgi:TolB protein